MGQLRKLLIFPGISHLTRLHGPEKVAPASPVDDVDDGENVGCQVPLSGAAINLLSVDKKDVVSFGLPQGSITVRLTHLYRIIVFETVFENRHPRSPTKRLETPISPFSKRSSCAGWMCRNEFCWVQSHELAVKTSSSSVPIWMSLTGLLLWKRSTVKSASEPLISLPLLLSECQVIGIM